MDALADSQRALELLSDWRWRLNNLYRIKDEKGHEVTFKMNWAQEQLYEGMWYMNLILKARQHGITTFVDLFILDACMFNSNVNAGIIAHTLGDARIIFEEKIKFPYDRLPEGLRLANPATQDSAQFLRFKNQSTIRVGTSMRSGTLQYLHISEYGKICAKYPEKAREVRTGALNTLHAGQIGFIESTAEGQTGDFYDMAQRSQTQARRGVALTEMDFKFWFFGWWQRPEYVIDPTGVEIPDHMERYFADLEAKEGIVLSEEQRAWYVKKAEQQKGDMKREFPATPREAFEATAEGAYFSDQIMKAEHEGRIGDFPYQPGAPVHTFWDIGTHDYTVIWFCQFVGPQIHVIDYYQVAGEGAPYHMEQLEKFAFEKGYVYGSHYLPHDVRVKEWGSGRTRIESLLDLGLKVVPVPMSNVDDGIHAVRMVFDRCWFDAEACDLGLKALRAYRKEWDDINGMWKDKPMHDWASHGADGFRYMAMSYREMLPPAPPKKVEGLEKITMDVLVERQKRKYSGEKRI